MTNAAGLDANAYLSLTGRSDGPLYKVKSPGLYYFDRPIRFSHLRLQSICTDCLVFVHKNFERGDRLDHPSLLSRRQAKCHSQTPEKMKPLLGSNPEFS